MERKSKRIAMLLLALAEMVVGLLLLVKPERFTGGIIVCCGGLLSVSGLWQVIRYLLMKPLEAALKQLLFRGLCSLLLGLFMVFHAEWLLSLFPVLATLYGICILLVGLYRIQWFADSVRLHTGRWGWQLAGALLALVLAVVTLLNPFATTQMMWLFIGIALILEGVLDLVSLLLGMEKTQQKQSIAS